MANTDNAGPPPLPWWADTRWCSIDVDQWKKDLVNAEFETSHGGYQEGDHPYFCKNCGGKSLSTSEAEACWEKEHQVFQAKKCSGKFGYRCEDMISIEQELNLRGVCIFSINHGLIYFPKSRVKMKKSTLNNNDSSSRATNTSGANTSQSFKCICCGFDCMSKKAQYEEVLFCSILCKLVCPVDEPRLVDLMASPEPERRVKWKEEITTAMTRQRDVGRKRKIPEKSVNDDNNDNNEMNHDCKIAKNSTSFRKRSRKGVPRRAPFPDHTIHVY